MCVNNVYNNVYMYRIVIYIQSKMKWFEGFRDHDFAIKIYSSRHASITLRNQFAPMVYFSTSCKYMNANTRTEGKIGTHTFEIDVVQTFLPAYILILPQKASDIVTRYNYSTKDAADLYYNANTLIQ